MGTIKTKPGYKTSKAGFTSRELKAAGRRQQSNLWKQVKCATNKSTTAQALYSLTDFRHSRNPTKGAPEISLVD